MDSGIVCKYYSVDEAIENGAAPVPISFDKTDDVRCTIDIMDHLLACEVTLFSVYHPFAWCYHFSKCRGKILSDSYLQISEHKKLISNSFYKIAARHHWFDFFFLCVKKFLASLVISGQKIKSDYVIHFVHF